MNEVMIDTDTLSLFLRNDPKVAAIASKYLTLHSGFTFSIITSFEILRGLEVKSAARQLQKFGQIRVLSKEVNLSQDVISKAASIYAELYRQGRLIGDADILIAATALQLSLPLITNNENHFNRSAGLQVVNWAV